LAQATGNATALTISAATLTVTPSPSPATMTYGGAAPAVAPSYSGFVNGTVAVPVAPTCTTTVSSTSAAGSYPGSSSCQGGTPPANYTFSYATGAVTVNAATVTVTASSPSMTYGGTVPTITPIYGAFANGQNSSVVTTAPVCTTTALATSPVGSLPTTGCSGAAAANYTFTYVAGNVTIGKASLTITASSTGMTYGGTPPAVTPGYSGFVNGDSASSLAPQAACTTTASNSTPAGTDPGANTCSGAVDTNYTISYVAGNVVVGKVPLTITAPSPTLTADSAIPTLTPTYGGFVNGDSATSLTTAPTCTTTATGTSLVGTYPVTCSGAVDSNYTISYVAGTLTLTGPVAGVSLPSLTFAPLLSKSTSSAQTVMLSNTGSLPLAITSIVATGNFAQTNGCGSSVAVGSNCTISVTFTPQSGGALTGAVTITDNSNEVTGSTQTVSLSGTGQDFSLTFTSGTTATITTAPGQLASITFSVGGLGGLTQPITFTCTGAPFNASCSVLPNPLIPTSSTQNITISFYSTAGLYPGPGSHRLPPAPLGQLPVWWLLALLMTAGTAAFWGGRQPGVRRRRATFLVLVVGMLLTLAVAACHAPANMGTPAGSYTLTVTGTVGSGSTAVSHSQNVTVNIT
jgi:hypothetical protein